jgi:cellulose synthase/poly-beta-1,6-N-acetylglucosamine synthase-like glycosyltransferase
MSGTDATAAAIFVTALAVLAYIYFGYPALIWVIARLRPRPVAKQSIHPSVSLLVPVHNEQAILREKLENCLSLEYPRDELEVLVLSDGSDDASAAPRL